MHLGFKLLDFYHLVMFEVPKFLCFKQGVKSYFKGDRLILPPLHCSIDVIILMKTFAMFLDEL